MKKLKKPKDKWKFAIGTTSRVPDSDFLHYFIADIDETNWSKNLVEFLESAPNSMIQKTPNGWHIYTDYKMAWGNLLVLLTYVGADPAWITIGKERGYYFLADKSQLNLPWPVEHMVLHYGKKKT